MGKRKRVKEGSLADYTIKGADMAFKGVKGLSRFIKKRQARKRLPEEVKSLIEAIEKFIPSRRYRNEFPYQTELTGWLKGKYGFVDIETPRGHSRPDIVTGDIAIEVKGPTSYRDLQTISDKIMRYSQHFGKVLIVLFEVEVNEGYYQEWLKGINNQYPDVIVIRK